MADTGRMGLTYSLVISLLGLTLVNTFNLDLKSPYIFKDPNEQNTFFGYSLAIHKSFTLLVGAPLSTKTNTGDKPYGTVYSCNLRTPTTPCKLLAQVDDLDRFVGQNKTSQWMGATVYSNNERILACAPRYKTYNLKKTIMYQGKCESIDLYDKDSSFVWRPCLNRVSNIFEEFQNCQVGFSASLFGGSDRSMLAGAPNVQLNSGLLITAKSDGKDKSFTKYYKPDIYLGYSSTTGFLMDADTLILVGGAPRGDKLSGKVVLYSVSNTSRNSTIYDPSKKVGTYFGAAMASGDINKDKKTDLLIGAPYFFEGDSYNEGIVYVYLKDKADNLVLKQSLRGDKKDGPLKKSLFGLSVGSVGDLNRDGHADFAVGAPWGGKDGKGIVYIYYGTTSTSEPLKQMHVLTPSTFADAGKTLDGFGYSFSEYYPYGDSEEIYNDVDRNNYPDLAIGAYRSGESVVLRSRPVITIIGTLNLDKTIKIDLYSKENLCGTEKCLKDVKVCFVLVGVGLKTLDGDIEYTLQLDTQQEVAKRAHIKDGSKKLTEVTKVMSAGAALKCNSYTIYLTNNTKDMYREMELRLGFKYVEPASCAVTLCPIANKLSADFDVKTIPYIVGCSDDGNNECNSDLVVKMRTKIPNKIIQVGETRNIDIIVDVTNKRENAFANFLHVVYPKELVPNRVLIEGFSGSVIWDSDVSKDSGITTLSVTLTHLIKTDTTNRVHIQFGVQPVKKGTKNISLKAIASTGSVEMNDPDDVDVINIKVSLISNLTVSGNVLPEIVKWKKGVTSTGVVGPHITHTFFYQNLGPSSVDSSNILIEFPVKYKDNYILNIISFTVEGSDTSKHDVGQCSAVALNVLNLDIKGGTRVTNDTKVRKRRESTSVLVVKCSDKDIYCTTIKCSINLLQNSEDVTVIIKSTLVEATFETVVKESLKITAYTKFTTTAVSKPENAPKDYTNLVLTVNSPYLTKSGGEGTIDWWIILLCVLAAILIIAIIVFIMYKKGFFKRKNMKAEEDEKLRQDDTDE